MSRAHVVLSPHPDDAVWSVAGRIPRWTRRGEPVTVITVFDGDGATPPEGWRAVAEPHVRRREDIAALDVLGVRRVSVGLAEAALRADDGVPRYGGPRRLFGPVHDRDGALPDVVAAAVREELGPDVLLHGPLAAGHHVDHVLVRRAAELVRGTRILYYEDFPYRLRERDHLGMRATHAPVDLPVWLCAATVYASQIAALFGSVRTFEATLLRRAETHGLATRWRYADRFWSVGQ